MDGSDPTTDRFKYVDGDEERPAWGGWNAGGECRIDFEKPVTFRRFRMVSLTLSGAALEAKGKDGWVTLHTWTHCPGREFLWEGDPVEAASVRIVPQGTRMGENGPAGPSLAELGLYPK